MEQNADLGIFEVKHGRVRSGQKLSDFDIFYTSIQFPFSFALLYFSSVDKTIQGDVESIIASWLGSCRKHLLSGWE